MFCTDLIIYYYINELNRYDKNSTKNGGLQFNANGLKKCYALYNCL